MSIESTRQALTRYFETEGPATIAEDAVYKIMGTGQEARGREAVRQLLHDFYSVIFDRDAETANFIVGDGKAAWEGYVVGRHNADFAGIPASGKEVRVPICVCYDIENDQIKRARIYFETEALRKQSE